MPGPRRGLGSRKTGLSPPLIVLLTVSRRCSWCGSCLSDLNTGRRQRFLKQKKYAKTSHLNAVSNKQRRITFLKRRIPFIRGVFLYLCNWPHNFYYKRSVAVRALYQMKAGFFPGRQIPDTLVYYPRMFGNIAF